MERLNLNAMRQITPSKHNPWAEYHVGKFSPAQERKAAAMAHQLASNRRRFDLPETYVVRLPLELRSLHEAPQFADILCPVITASRSRTRILVIAPDGSDQWVDWKVAK
ncbi:hypothetical protein [Sphingomonas koreensis]|jgi:hypothetical protein|uniref:hypothetical protein n=1 Tax=Sphingomonas koreensis TaxID=93064 RepID=UPI00234E6CC6|nr:hypothetical protein [Sphingomonas koreensis]MDC7810532.1 hypothetical protein [Sphingomonas koreensis]